MLQWLADRWSHRHEVPLCVCPRKVCRAVRATGFAGAAMAIIFLAGFLVLSDAARRQHEDELRGAEMQGSVWRATLEAHVVNLTAVADTLAGFIAGGAYHVPNHSGTVAQRTAEVLHPAAFGTLAQRLLGKNLGLLTLEIQPSGIINQVYPPDPKALGYDLFNDPSTRSDILNCIALGGTVLAGPLELVQGMAGLVVRSPVFIGPNATLDSWWGNAVVTTTLDGFIRSTGIQDLPAGGYHFQLRYLNQNTGLLQVIATSIAVMDLACAVWTPVQLPNGFHWDLFLVPVNGWSAGLTPSTIVAISVSGFLAGLLAAALYYGGRWFLRKHQRNVSSAPTHPPVIVVFTDIESSTHLWNCHPQAMQQALLLHNRIVRRLIKAFGAYEVKTLGDSFMIACKSARAALDLCVAIQRELRAERKWPEDLEEFYGCGERWLRVRMGAHRCVKVQCLFDEVSKGYDYLGDDINKCARIESAALGGEILLSDELATEALQLGEYRVTCLGRRTLRGFKEDQVLHRLVLDCVVSSPVPRETSWFGMEPHATATIAPTPRELHSPTNFSFARGPGAALSVEQRAALLVQEYCEVSAEEFDAEQLLVWVRLLCQVLRLLLDNLPKPTQSDILRQVCAVWGVKASTHNRVPQLALSLARLLIGRYPNAFPSGEQHGCASFVVPRRPSQPAAEPVGDTLGVMNHSEAVSDVSELHCPAAAEVPEPLSLSLPVRSVRLSPSVTVSD